MTAGRELVDIRSRVDPEVTAAMTASTVDFHGLGPETLAEVREATARRQHRPADPTAPVVHTDVPIGGEPATTVRVHRRREASGPAPAIFWIHGGGYVMGEAAGDDGRFDQWCDQLGVVGVSAAYRLSPEASYPAPLDDCLAGFEWMMAHTDELGIDRDRVGIGGRSAGGGLAAGLVLLLRDRGRRDVRFQILIHPMLDDRMDTESARWDDPMWPPPANRFGWRAYLGPLADGDVPAYAAAARAVDLRGLPPTYLSVGGLDAFSDSVLAYASRLRHAGVSTDLHVFADVPHGFDSLAPATSVARRANAALDGWLLARLERLTAGSES